MNPSDKQRRNSRSQRALVVALVVVVNAGIAGFIDRLAAAGTSTAEVAGATQATVVRG